jgi:hypothetical protein
VLVPSEDAFAALARSSPWRWSTLRFTVSWSGDHWKPGAVRAWARRPDSLRVESVDGALLRAERTDPPTVAGYGSGGGSVRRMVWASQTTTPALRADGLVAERPGGPFLTYDDPMHDSYHWVAMLDPAELADGNGAEDGMLDPLSIHSVAEVEHAGRRAWEAIVDPTPEYEPRCGCCPLLRSLLVDEREWGVDSENLLDEYPEAYRVRLDVGTGVCVLTEAIGGSIAGAGHDLRIEAVDEPMAEDLFVEPHRWPSGRAGWQPLPPGPGRQ